MIAVFLGMALPFSLAVLAACHGIRAHRAEARAFAAHSERLRAVYGR